MTRMSAPVPHSSNHQQAVDKFLWVSVRLSRLRKPLNNRFNIIMASSEFGTGKSIVVLAIVVGCFAILWPKIFYPMMQAAFAITSPGSERDERSFRPRDRPPHLQPGMLNANPRERAPDGTFIKEGRPFPHPSSRQPVKAQSKSGGAMSIIMPIYTIGIVVFFLYTVLKLVFKKPPENEKKPLIKDFHMDPEYHKFVCQQPLGNETRPSKRHTESTVKNKEQPKPTVFSEKNGNFDDKDYEIYKLRRKLEETESAMERIMKHMGAVSDCLSNACLLKEDPMISKQNGMSHTSPGSDSVKTKPSLRVNKRKKKTFKNITAVTQPLLIEKEESIEEAEELYSECANQENLAEDLVQDQQLKRDSSINSETSSFELLSQGISSISGIANSSEAESDDNDDEENDDNDAKNEDTNKLNNVLESIDKSEDEDDENVQVSNSSEGEIEPDCEVEDDEESFSAEHKKQH